MAVDEDVAATLLLSLFSLLSHRPVCCLQARFWRGRFWIPVGDRCDEGQEAIRTVGFEPQEKEF